MHLFFKLFHHRLILGIKPSTRGLHATQKWVCALTRVVGVGQSIFLLKK